jgi:xanthine dehydrogenase iron-sulfur cluster and FAD-binding subunit A
MWHEYINATKIIEAINILSARPGHCRLVAGGTDLLLEIERGLHPDLDTLVDITRVPELNHISKEDDGLIHIGALVTHNDCINSPLLYKFANPLVRACVEVGSPQIRNRGTVIGNLVTASPANDTITPLCALGASIVLQSKTNQRIVRLSDFYTGVRNTLLQPDEVVMEVQFPAMENSQKGTFYKLALRRAQAISIVNTAIILNLENGVIKSAQITLGAVAPTIIHAAQAESFLKNKPFNNLIIQDASDLAAHEVFPISDIRSSLAYRKQMVKTIVKRSLLSLLEDKGDPHLERHYIPSKKIFADQIPPITSIHNENTPILTTINGTKFEFGGAHKKTLLHLLRENAKLTGTKEGCNEGECGACTVLLNNKAVMSCLVPAANVHGSEIRTIEGLTVEGKLHPIQQSFIEEGAVQCGYCSPGFIMSAVNLLEENPNPTVDQIRQAISGNLCRCTGYYKIISAIEHAVQEVQK